MVNKEQKAGRASILIVSECEEDESLTKALTLAGYDTHQASTWMLVLHQIEAAPPALVVLDAAMSGMPWIELTVHLREKSAIPFMFLLSDDGPAAVALAAESGAVCCLMKPMTTSQLVPAIAAAVAQGAEIKRLRASEEVLTAAVADGRNTNLAVGLLMERYGIDRNTAFQSLRQQARFSRRKVSDVATDLLNAAEMLNAFRPLRLERQA